VHSNLSGRYLNLCSRGRWVAIADGNCQVGWAKHAN
jgi:hypothetical protein